MYITEDVGDIYVDISSTERIRLNAESAEKLRKITYNADGSKKSEVFVDYDYILGLASQISTLNTNLANKSVLTINTWENATSPSTSEQKTSFIINKVKDDTTYEAMETNNLIDPDQIYLVEGPDNKMDKENPVGTGSFSMNRQADTVIGDCSHAEGYAATASGEASHAEGAETIASGDYSHTEGLGTTASGAGAHAEGGDTTASGEASHAEGCGTAAISDYSHAEGYETTADGITAHAEGSYTIASGMFSHAEGSYTIASSSTQHVEGSANIEDVEDNYIHIVGNGESNDARSNAHTLDWEGNAWFAGDVYVDSTSGTNKDEGSKKLATEEYVTNLLSSAGGAFYAAYGTTTNAEIKAAYDAGKVILCAYETRIYRLYTIPTGSNTIYFTSEYDYDGEIDTSRYVSVSTSNQWTSTYGIDSSLLNAKWYNGSTEISSSTGYYRPIRVSTAEPTASDGNVGDIWIQYSL